MSRTNLQQDEEMCRLHLFILYGNTHEICTLQYLLPWFADAKVSSQFDDVIEKNLELNTITMLGLL